MAKQKTLLMLFRRDIHQLEYEPATQYRFHFALTWFWAVTMVALPFIPVLYGHQLPALVVQEISLWANFATHFGAMSAALAAKQGKEIKHLQHKNLRETTQISTNTLALNTQIEHTSMFDA